MIFSTIAQGARKGVNYLSQGYHNFLSGFVGGGSGLVVDAVTGTIGNAVSRGGDIVDTVASVAISPAAAPVIKRFISPLRQKVFTDDDAKRVGGKVLGLQLGNVLRRQAEADFGQQADRYSRVIDPEYEQGQAWEEYLNALGAGTFQIGTQAGIAAATGGTSIPAQLGILGATNAAMVGGSESVAEYNKQIQNGVPVPLAADRAALSFAQNAGLGFAEGMTDYLFLGLGKLGRGTRAVKALEPLRKITERLPKYARVGAAAGRGALTEGLQEGVQGVLQEEISMAADRDALGSPLAAADRLFNNEGTQRIFWENFAIGALLGGAFGGGIELATSSVPVTTEFLGKIGEEGSVNDEVLGELQELNEQERGDAVAVATYRAAAEKNADLPDAAVYAGLTRTGKRGIDDVIGKILKRDEFVTDADFGTIALPTKAEVAAQFVEMDLVGRTMEQAEGYRRVVAEQERVAEEQLRAQSQEVLRVSERGVETRPGVDGRFSLADFNLQRIRGKEITQPEVRAAQTQGFEGVYTDTGESLIFDDARVRRVLGDNAVREVQEQHRAQFREKIFEKVPSLREAEVEFVDGLIDGKGIGSYLNGTIKISKQGELPTTLAHEGAHHYFDTGLDTAGKNRVIEAIKSEYVADVQEQMEKHGIGENEAIQEVFSNRFAEWAAQDAAPKTFLERVWAKLRNILRDIVESPELRRVYRDFARGEGRLEMARADAVADWMGEQKVVERMREAFYQRGLWLPDVGRMRPSDPRAAEEWRDRYQRVMSMRQTEALYQRVTQDKGKEIVGKSLFANPLTEKEVSDGMVLYAMTAVEGKMGAQYELREDGVTHLGFGDERDPRPFLSGRLTNPKEIADYFSTGMRSLWFSRDKSFNAVWDEDVYGDMYPPKSEEPLYQRGGHQSPSEEDSPAYDMTVNLSSDFYDLYDKTGKLAIGGHSPRMDDEVMEILKNIRGNPDAEITIYRSVPNEVKNKSINPGDFVALLEEYAVDHAERHFIDVDVRSYARVVKNRPYTILKKKVKASEIFNDGNSVQEWGYHPQSDVFYQRGDTESPEFKKWFGDSVVVDEDGNPLVVYHGGVDIENIEIFDRYMADEYSQTVSGGEAGFFFTNSKVVAKDYTKHATGKREGKREVIPYIEAYLRMEKPIVFSGLHWKEGDMTLLTSASISLNNNSGVVTEEVAEEINAIGLNGPQKKVEAGDRYDGIVALNSSDPATERTDTIFSNIYVVFNSTQIKSVDNRGTFDPNDPNILYQRGEDGKSWDEILGSIGAKRSDWSLRMDQVARRVEARDGVVPSAAMVRKELLKGLLAYRAVKPEVIGDVSYYPVYINVGDGKFEKGMPRGALMAGWFSIKDGAVSGVGVRKWAEGDGRGDVRFDSQDPVMYEKVGDVLMDHLEDKWLYSYISEAVRSVKWEATGELADKIGKYLGVKRGMLEVQRDWAVMPLDEDVGGDAPLYQRKELGAKQAKWLKEMGLTEGKDLTQNEQVQLALTGQEVATPSKGKGLGIMARGAVRRVPDVLRKFGDDLWGRYQRFAHFNETFRTKQLRDIQWASVSKETAEENKQRKKEGKKEIVSFLEGYKEMGKDGKLVQRAFDIAFTRNDMDKVLEMAGEYGFAESVNALRDDLDALHERIKQQGLDIGWLESYLPRFIKQKNFTAQDAMAALESIKATEAYERSLRREAGRLRDEATAKTEEELNQEELREKVNREKKRHGRSLREHVPNLRKRIIDEITNKNIDNYVSPVEAVEGYYSSIGGLLGSMKFFGHRSLTEYADLALSDAGREYFDEWLFNRERPTIFATQDSITEKRDELMEDWAGKIRYQKGKMGNKNQPRIGRGERSPVTDEDALREVFLKEMSAFLAEDRSPRGWLEDAYDNFKRYLGDDLEINREQKIINITKSVVNTRNRLLWEGKFKDTNELEELMTTLKGVFEPLPYGWRVWGSVISEARMFTYGILLGSPLRIPRDLISLIHIGLRPDSKGWSTLGRAMKQLVRPKSARGRPLLTPKELGLDSYMAEFYAHERGKGWFSRAGEKVFTFTGMRSVDDLRRVLSNEASMIEMGDYLRDKGDEAFIEKFDVRHLVPEEQVAGVVEAVRKGQVTTNVGILLFAQEGMIIPNSQYQAPVLHKHPVARATTMLLGEAIHETNFMFNKALKQVEDHGKLGGSLRILVAILLPYLLAGVSTEYLVAAIRQKRLPQAHEMPIFVMDTMARLLFTSRWDIRSLTDGDFTAFAQGFVPALGAYSAPVDSVLRLGMGAASDDPEKVTRAIDKGLRKIPIVGDPWYSWFSDTAADDVKKYEEEVGRSAGSAFRYWLGSPEKKKKVRGLTDRRRKGLLDFSGIGGIDDWSEFDGLNLDFLEVDIDEFSL